MGYQHLLWIFNVQIFAYLFYEVIIDFIMSW